MVFTRLCRAIFQDIFTILATIGVLLLTSLVVFWKTRPKPGRNPFTLDHLQSARPLVTDPATRNAVIKKRFRVSRVPDGLDAIVVGSGVGGLSVAVLLARAGRRVLVLEQHDQAGGCCHAFTDRGYEFDTGIHYVGKMQEGTETRILSDYITGDQLVWEAMDDVYDTVAIGPPDRARRYPMKAGRQRFVANLHAMFPQDGEAINKFMKILDENRGAILALILPKLYPKLLVKLLILTGYIYRMFPTFFKYAAMSLGQALDGITDNPELKAVLSYAYGDLGPPPAEMSLPIYCSLMNHYISGAFYPRGGSTELAFHAAPIIRSNGGDVLVNAPVTQILISDSGRASGVRVTKGSGDTDIMADIVISDAGVPNTFHKLLPHHIARQTALYRTVSDVGPSTASVTLFVGLEGTKEELKLPAGNTWAFLSPDLDGDLARYMKLDEDAASSTFSPMLFIGFSSAKESTWETRFPGKSTCSVIALCPHQWFSTWANEHVKKRGSEYETLKMAFGQLIWHQVELLFPQLDGKPYLTTIRLYLSLRPGTYGELSPYAPKGYDMAVRCLFTSPHFPAWDCHSQLDYLEVATPLSYRHYIGCRDGEIYGLNHSVARVTPAAIMELRAETDIPGLYLTGQDVFTGGFAGALYGGLMCASGVLHRNLMADLKAYARLARKAHGGKGDPIHSPQMKKQMY